MKGGHTGDSATYQTKHLSLVVRSDRISLLLKSDLSHHGFLQKGRKGPQRTKYGKFGLVAQILWIILWITHRRVLMQATFFFFFSELHLCKQLYVSTTNDSCCIFCDLTQFYTKGLYLMSILSFPLCVLPVGIQFAMIIESQCHFNWGRFLPF